MSSDTTAPDISEAALVEALRRAARPLTGAGEDYDPLMELIGGAPFALIGEASHGTHEFYRARAEITKRLIVEKGFTAVAVEADWPDAWRVNRYVRGQGEDIDAVEALADFRRFPTWMWRNAVVVEFVEWLRDHNANLAPGTPMTGFYGVDLYSLHASAKMVLRYLRAVDPEAARQAAERYACFDHYGDDTQVSGFMTRLQLAKSCEDAAIAQLMEMQRRVGERIRKDGGDEELFNAEQNARVVANAEEYYRTMFLRDVSSWNLRDRHMVDTIDAIADFQRRQELRPRIAVWAHNSHLGDARATQTSERGELNVGQLMRERYSAEAVLIGLTTHHGWVTAATDWGAPAERKRVRPALAGSYEALFHLGDPTRFLLTLRGAAGLAERLQGPRLERAIGVIYRPETERQSHYFGARLPAQFDAVLHFDDTRAVEPLETTAGWEAGEAPETFPVGV